MDDLLDGFFPDPIRTTWAPISDRVDALLEPERPLIEKAVPRRQHEFATGRALARQLLEGFGHPDFPIVREGERLPRWPEGIVGSITHSHAMCMAAVARASEYAGVGIDLEPDASVERDIERVVCHGDEHAWVAGAGESERGRRCRVVFSVKEAVYKAFYPRTRQFWGFHDVSVEIDLEAERYRARLPESAGLAEVTGRVRRGSGWILSGLALESPAPTD